MNIFHKLIKLFILLTAPVFAAGPPLTIAVEKFRPPFEVQQGSQEVYGFDIDMMNALCKIMDRTCIYKAMELANPLDEVIAKKVDVALGAIIITAHRAQQVNFSMPYLVSYSRFLGLKSLKKADTAFSISDLDNTTIGLEADTTYEQQIKEMDIKNPKIKIYNTMNLLIDALGKKEIDYVILNNRSALYWEANSGGAFAVFGPPFQYGFGYGIAVGKENPDLQAAINKALLQYQNSPQFDLIYNKYFQL